MWIFLSDAFFSVVHKDCKPDEVIVRARRKGDIERVFPRKMRSKITKLLHADYLYRTTVKRSVLAEVMKVEIDRITYANFKDSVDDDELHSAYLRVWSVMYGLRPARHSGVEAHTTR